ncbi:MAG: metal-dependent hydrolase [Desulfovibrio sp.]|nr:metal-dependent hydrolase [Desulfovibrio sp.]
MRWFTHQVCGVGVTLLGSSDPLVLGCAWLGSIVPDYFDQTISKVFGRNERARQRIFATIHRGISHWFGLWLGVYALGSFANSLLIRQCVAGFAIGGFFHCALDMLTPKGIPLLPFFRKHFGAPLVRTGSAGEYVFLAVLVMCLSMAQRFDHNAVQALMDIPKLF